MKNDYLAIISFVVVFFLVTFFDSFILRSFHIYRSPIFINYFTCLLIFLLPSIVSGFISIKKSIRNSVFGSIINQIIIAITLPIYVISQFKNPGQYEFQAMGPMLQKFGQINSHVLFISSYILAMISLPFVMLIATLGGFLGSKLRLVYIKHKK